MIKLNNQILRNSILVFLIILYGYLGYTQDIYKTPYGTKYHLSSCRMVENVSVKLNGLSDIEKYNLTPCKFCKPPLFSKISNSLTTIQDKAVGVSKTVQCNGRTKKGTRCRHMTSLANGYCFQHRK